MNPTAWTDERVEALKGFWEAGLSCSQCADELNKSPFNELPPVSRNGAIGKIHRLGLSGRIKGYSAPREPRSREPKPAQYVARASRIVSRASVLAPAFEPEINAEMIAHYDNVVPLHQRLSLVQLTEATCHWPIGDPLAPDFFFCGGKALTGLPYCAHHQRIAHPRGGG